MGLDTALLLLSAGNIAVVRLQSGVPRPAGNPFCQFQSGNEGNRG